MLNIIVIILIVAIVVAYVAIGIREQIKFNEMKRNLKADNDKFNIDSECRIIMENIGDGDTYYPQFKVGDEWKFFMYVFMESPLKRSFASKYSAEDFIKNKKCFLKPISKVVYGQQ